MAKSRDKFKNPLKKENWENIKDLFHESLERPIRERDLYLERVCGNNREMLKEVRQLLAEFESNQDFLENQAVGEVADLIVAAESKVLANNGNFGRYRIKSLIGEGGMGKVFLAEDTELERLAAVKILSSLLSKDENRVRRFVREAKAASSLNHPNILTIYEIGRADDAHFIAAEYVEGETLRQRQNRQPLNLNEILDVIVQVVSALAAAHQARIIHRDIKPENIMLRLDGIVKVLDFGLAKLVPNTPEDISQTAETQTGMNTAPGIVLGTAAYMSPEQARGKAVDARTDIWSCGVCLYELITGRQPFDGETMSDVIAEILTREPLPLPSAIPSELKKIVEKTLQKDCANRYANIVDLLNDLKSVRGSLAKLSHAVPLTIYRNVENTRDNRKATRFSTFATTVFSGFRLYPVHLIAGTVFIAMLFGLASFFAYRKTHLPQISQQAVRWYEGGIEAAQNGNYYKAQKLLEQAVQADENFLQAHAKLAEMQMELDYEDKAAQSLLRVTELMPQYSLDKAETDRLLAALATVRRDNRSAATTYQEIVNEVSEPEKAFVYFDIGRALEKSDDSAKATDAYLETIRRDPQFAAAFLRLGRIYWFDGDETKALDAFEKAATIYTANSNYDGLGELYYLKGALYNYNDNLPEAEKNLKKSLEIAQATSNLPLHIKATMDLGRIGYSNGDTTNSQQLIDEALRLSQTENLENLTTNGLIDLGTLFYFKGEYDKATQYLEQALRIARTNGGKRAESRALLSLGNLSLLQSRPAQAVKYVEPTIKYFDANDFRQEKSIALLTLGSAYDQIGKYSSALELLETVSARAKEENDQAMIAQTEAAIGLVLIHNERFAEGIEHCENSFRINQSLGREQLAAYDFLNKAQGLVELGRFDETRQQLAQVSATAEKSKDKQLVAWSHLSLAKAALYEGQNEAAIAESKKSLQISGEQVKGIVISANLTAALAELNNNSAKALSYWQIADEAIKKIEESRLLADVKLTRAEIFLKEKNASEALREALESRAIFAERQAKYSEWRSLAIAAKASLILGDLSKAKEYASQCASISTFLQKSWGAENFQSFKKRRDTIFYQSVIDEVVAEK